MWSDTQTGGEQVDIYLVPQPLCHLRNLLSTKQEPAQLRMLVAKGHLQGPSQPPDSIHTGGRSLGPTSKGGLGQRSFWAAGGTGAAASTAAAPGGSCHGRSHPQVRVPSCM